MKRLLVSFLCTILLFSNISIPTYADTSTLPAQFTATAEMLGGDLTVIIPDSIPLSKVDDNFTGTGEVTAYGVVNPTSVLSVSTDAKATYVNQSENSVTVDADVTFGTEGTAKWNASELKANIDAETKKSYTVTASVPMTSIEYIGEYTSNIVFNISLGTASATTYYMGYNFTDSTLVNYSNQNDIAYDILPQADTVAELKEFSTDKNAIESKGYDKVVESSDASLVIPSTIENKEVVGVSFDTFFADNDIATYVNEIQVPSSVTGIELSDTSSSASTTVITCENVRTAVNLSKKLPSAAKIRFKFEANGERDYTEFFTYDTDERGIYIKGFSEYGYDKLSSYGAGSTVEINLPVTYQGQQVIGLEIVGYADDFTQSLTDANMPDQVWVVPSSYSFCSGFWNNSTFSSSNPCTKLVGLIFNEGLTSIAVGAFEDCTNLTSVVIPASVTSIGSKAFYNCTSLSNVTFADGFNGTIDDNAFANTSIDSVTLPSSVTRLNGFAFGNDENIVVSNTNVKKIVWNINHDVPTVTNTGGLMYTQVNFADGIYIGAGSSAVLAKAQSNDGVNAVVSSDVADSAFKTAEGKTYQVINITNGVTSIGASAFSKCTATIKKADLRNVTSIGQKAFEFTTIDTLIVNNSAITKYALSNATIKNLYIDYTDSSYSLVAYATKNIVVENVYFSGTEAEYTTFLGSTSNNALRDNKDSMNIIYNATMP